MDEGTATHVLALAGPVLKDIDDLAYDAFEASPSGRLAAARSRKRP